MFGKSFSIQDFWLLKKVLIKIADILFYVVDVGGG